MLKSTPFFEFNLQETEFSIPDRFQCLQENCPQSGANVYFTGQVRDLSKKNDRIKYLELQTYEPLAISQVEQLGHHVFNRFDIDGLDIIHRYGRLTPEELIVYVGVASKHRSEAYLASQMTMDFLKSKIAFWKKEHYFDQTEPQWIKPTDQDDQALQQWKIN